MLMNELWRGGFTALVGAAIIAAGIPVYFLTRRARSK
jgi:hypothetical protein